jgi:hypothetical protein
MKLVRDLTLVLPAIALATLLGASTAAAQRGGARHGVFAIGGMVGDPTGLSMKFRTRGRLAIDLAVGWQAIYADDAQAHADLLWGFDLSRKPRTILVFYLGFGPKVGFWGVHRTFHTETDGVFFGARVPFGLAWEFLRKRLDVFVEVAPGMTFVPDVTFYPDAAVGARYWF